MLEILHAASGLPQYCNYSPQTLIEFVATGEGRDAETMHGNVDAGCAEASITSMDVFFFFLETETRRIFKQTKNRVA